MLMREFARTGYRRGAISSQLGPVRRMARLTTRCAAWLTAIALACTSIMLTAFAQSAPVDDVSRYVWDLSSLYANDTAWEAEKATILSKVETIGRLKGTLGRNARSLADAMDEIADLRSRAAKMAVYGVLLEQVDSRSEISRTRSEVGARLESEVESAISFVGEEIRKIGHDRVMQWLRAQPRLERHRRRINRILRESPHTLSPDAQAVIASMSRWPNVAADGFWALHESDLGWPTIKRQDGTEVKVTLSNYYLGLRRSRDAGERSAAITAYLSRLRTLEDVFGLLYTRRIEADLAIARHRKFKDGMEAIWFLREGMPNGSHRIMVDVARSNLDTLRRYTHVRSRALGLEHYNYGDLNTPPVIDRRFAVAEAMENAAAALAPLGQEYQERLRERLQKSWMHLPPLPEKRFTFGIFPPVGGANPYFIMTYNGTYNNSRSFAGAAALTMAFADIPPDRVPDTRDDPGIYSNGVIYVGNILHDDYIRGQARNDKERIAYLVSSLDSLKRNYFDWTLITELDTRVQELVMKGDTPSGARISEMYLDLVRQYYERDDSTSFVPAIFGAEWMIESVPFLSYEHQFWPPAMATACLLVEKLRAGEGDVRKAMHQVLGRGDLDLTYQLLRPVGVDLATPTPYQAVIRRMNSLMDELEKLLVATEKNSSRD